METTDPSVRTPILAQSPVNEFVSWVAVWTWLAGLFFLFATISNFLYGVLDVRLLPVFENTFESFQTAARLVLDLGFYAWFTWLGERVYFLLTLVLSWIAPIEPFLPDIQVPSWCKDLALVSAILLRAERRAMGFARPLSTHAMSDQEREEWNAAIAGSPIVLLAIVRLFWAIVLALYFVANFFEGAARAVIGRRGGDFVHLFFGGAIMLGFAYFVHDLAIAISTASVKNGPARWHRDFLFWMTFSVLIATLASVWFFILNGALIDPLANA